MKLIKLITMIMSFICLVFQADAAQKYLGKNPGPVARRKSKPIVQKSQSSLAQKSQSSLASLLTNYPYSWNLFDAIAKKSRNSYAVNPIQTGDKFKFTFNETGICAFKPDSVGYSKFIVGQTLSNNVIRITLTIAGSKPSYYRNNMEAIIVDDAEDFNYADGDVFKDEGIYQYMGLVDAVSIFGYTRKIDLYKKSKRSK